jgi:hypothetical protein
MPARKMKTLLLILFATVSFTIPAFGQLGYSSGPSVTSLPCLAAPTPSTPGSGATMFSNSSGQLAYVGTDAQVRVLVPAPGRVTAQTAAVASVATLTVGSADTSYYISGNVNVTAATTATFTMTCTYTDETNTSRVLTMSFSNLSGTILTSITNVTGTGPYEGVVQHIRCKAGTTITIGTTGTFTSVTYNAEGLIITKS